MTVPDILQHVKIFENKKHFASCCKQLNNFVPFFSFFFSFSLYGITARVLSVDCKVFE